MLVKFTKYKYVENFRSGNLHMNSLSYFWNHGTEEQKDVFEGGILSISPQAFSGVFPEDFLESQIRDFYFQAVGYEYCHVFCMAKIGFTPLINAKAGSLTDVSIPPDMEALGKYAIIIDDEAEFLRRINRAIGNEKYLCGPVNYHPSVLNGERSEHQHNILLKIKQTFDINMIPGHHLKLDAFDKAERYRGQSEWRFCLYDGKKSTSAIDFDIGDLHDITHVVKTKCLIYEIRQLYQDSCKFQPDIYYGNASRKELRDLFYKLGDNQAWLLSTI